MNARQIVALPYAMLHETIHYIVARLLGFSAEWHFFHMTFYPKRHSWRVHAVVLAPAIAGLLAGGVVIGLMATKQSGYKLILGIFSSLIASLIWQYTCAYDWREFWHYQRHGEWPESSYTVPPSNQTIDQ